MGSEVTLSHKRAGLSEVVAEIVKTASSLPN